MDRIRRLPLHAAVDVLLPATIVLFAVGSSSVHLLTRIGGHARWIALIALAGVAVLQAVAYGPRLRSVPIAWLIAAAFVVVGVESALWSVDPRLTVSRVFTVGVLFVAAAALALGSPDARVAAARALNGVLTGIALVAVASLAVLAVSRGDAVLSATTGAGWRFRGVGQSPNTVPMLLSIGMPLAVWRALHGPRTLRWVGIALVLLFAGEIGFSGSRGAVIAGFGGAIATALALGRSAGAKLAVAAGLCALALVCVALSRIPNPAPVTDNSASQSSPVAATRGIDAEHVVRLEDEIGFPSTRSYIPPAKRTVFGASGRAQAWDGALHQGDERPVAGYGFGTEDSVFADRFYSFEGSFVENTYLGLFLQLGAAGVALLVALLAALAWSAARLVLRFPRGGIGPAAGAIGVLIAGVLIGGTQSGLLSVGNIAAASIWICVLTLPILARESLP